MKLNHEANTPMPRGPDDSLCAAPRTEAARGAQRHHRVRTDKLFAGAREIELEHGEAIYRLRITSLGKLILTK